MAIDSVVFVDDNVVVLRGIDAIRGSEDFLETGSGLEPEVFIGEFDEVVAVVDEFLVEAFEEDGETRVASRVGIA